MKKLIILFVIMTFSGIAFAETTENTESQKIENENSYLGINFEKQPEEKIVLYKTTLISKNQTI